jgi:hypothetical protein
MSDKEIHQGGCACGENRYETSGNPERARVCHCRYCQLRSGSPFGVGAWFKDENIKHISKNYNQYKFVTESGNSFETNFCKKCGTSVYWTISAPALKGLTAIAAATLHDQKHLILILNVMSILKHHLLTILQKKMMKDLMDLNRFIFP